MSVEFGPYMLRVVRKRLIDHGLGIDYPELHDIAALFSNNHLHLALSAFDPSRGEGKEGFWVSTVFYRYALRRVLALDRTREVFEVTLDVKDPEGSPEDVLERRWKASLADELPRQLAALPTLQRRALRLYFGLDGDEHTLAETASIMNTTVHFARLAITQALGALVARLGAAGTIDHSELRLAEMLFLEKLDVLSIAKMMAITPQSVKSRAKALGTKLRSSLRRRTSTRSEESLPREGFVLAAIDNQFRVSTNSSRRC